MKQQSERKSLSAWQVIKSIFAAALGVQNPDAHKRDFEHGSAVHYIIGGIVFTVLFVVVLIVIVRMVLGSAGG